MSCHSELTDEEGAGVHTWDFRDAYLRRALDWLRRGFLHGEAVEAKEGE
jgi:S-formylglutathione hydrolase FrmB